MKRTRAIAGLMAAAALTGCQAPADETVVVADETASGGAGGTAAVAEAPAAEASAIPAVAAAPGAPPFAVVYPGGSVSGPATIARGPDGGSGGILSFTTEASPESVVSFYRQRAEAAGLASVMAMNQGEARAYGAAADDGSGQLLRVVATPVEDGPTSVQLDWTAGG